MRNGHGYDFPETTDRQADFAPGGHVGQFKIATARK